MCVCHRLYFICPGSDNIHFFFFFNITMTYIDQYVTVDQLGFRVFPPNNIKEPPLCTETFITGIAGYDTV